MEIKVNSVLLLLGTLCAFLSTSASKKIKKAEDCEVCVGVVTKFTASIDSSSMSDMDILKKKFQEFCKNTRDHREERLCYYIGGLETSAVGMIPLMTKPISFGMPATKVCEKLNDRDSQICELKYEKKIDLTKANFKKLKVKNLRKILSDWGAECRGCAEKSDFIKRINELMPEKDPEAYAARQKKQEL